MRVFLQPRGSMECGIAVLRMVQHWARGRAFTGRRWKQHCAFTQERGLLLPGMLAALRQIEGVVVLDSNAGAGAAKLNKPALGTNRLAIVMIDSFSDDPAGKRTNPRHWVVVEGDQQRGVVRVGDPEGRYPAPAIERWAMLAGKGIRRIILLERRPPDTVIE